jgi:hypothetical protein
VSAYAAPPAVPQTAQQLLPTAILHFWCSRCWCTMVQRRTATCTLPAPAAD